MTVDMEKLFAVFRHSLDTRLKLNMKQRVTNGWSLIYCYLDVDC